MKAAYWFGTIFGWIWLILGAAWFACWAAFDEVPVGILYHALFDTAFGVVHLYIAKRMKDRLQNE